MHKNPENKLFNDINAEAITHMAYFITYSFLFGGLLYFVARHVILGHSIKETMTQSLIIIAIGLSAQLIKILPLGPNMKTFLIGLLLSSTYVFLYVLRNDNGFTTIWASIFIFIGISIFYTSKIILLTVATTGILIEFYQLYLNENIEIRIDQSDHFGRIGVLILVLFITMSANTLLKKRLQDNTQKVKQITEQNQALEQLNLKLTKSEQILQSQNEQLERNHRAIDRLAFYDTLTGLPKRQKLFDDIESYIETIRVKNTKEHFTLILIDLNNFKAINDLHGHDVGDHFLIHAATLIQSLVKPYPCNVYKIGSDDYVILTEKTNKPEPIMPILNSLITNFDSPMEYELYSIRTTISIGVSDYPNCGTHSKVLLRNADIALNQAKQIGRSNFVFFDDHLEEALLRKLNLQESLKMSIENNELNLVYQPIINAKSQEIESFEALLRWHNPNYGSISPVEFIPYAEENMSIIPIGLYVIRESMKTIKALNETCQTQYRVSVNVSSLQLHSRQFLNQLDSILKQTGFSPSLLELEITESVLIESFDEIITLLDTLRHIGVKISLDDFGTGYSSLTYLKKLPIDHIKIDKSFVHSLSQQDNPLVESIITLAHRLHINVIAEGIETTDQYNTLVNEGSDYAQGFLFAKPMPKEDLIPFIRQYNPIDNI